MLHFAKAVILFQGLSILEGSDAIQLNEHNQAMLHLANLTKNGTLNASKNSTNSTAKNLSKKVNGSVNATVKNHASKAVNSTLNKTNATAQKPAAAKKNTTHKVKATHNSTKPPNATSAKKNNSVKGNVSSKKNTSGNVSKNATTGNHSKNASKNVSGNATKAHNLTAKPKNATAIAGKNGTNKTTQKKVSHLPELRKAGIVEAKSPNITKPEWMSNMTKNAWEVYSTNATLNMYTKEDYKVRENEAKAKAMQEQIDK